MPPEGTAAPEDIPLAKAKLQDPNIKFPQSSPSAEGIPFGRTNKYQFPNSKAKTSVQIFLFVICPKDSYGGFFLLEFVFGLRIVFCLKGTPFGGT